jgi:hypothetical protein
MVSKYFTSCSYGWISVWVSFLYYLPTLPSRWKNIVRTRTSKRERWKTCRSALLLFHNIKKPFIYLEKAAVAESLPSRIQSSAYTEEWYRLSWEWGMNILLTHIHPNITVKNVRIFVFWCIYFSHVFICFYILPC